MSRYAPSLKETTGELPMTCVRRKAAESVSSAVPSMFPSSSFPQSRELWKGTHGIPLGLRQGERAD